LGRIKTISDVIWS